MARLLISYAHRDGAEQAQRLAADLERLGHEVWWDHNRLRGGASWNAEIEKAIDRSDVVLALLSWGSHLSHICRAEQLRALRRGKRVIPVLLQEDADRPIHLETKQYVPLDKLLDAVQGDEAAALPEKYRCTCVTAPPPPLNFVPRPAELNRLLESLVNEASERRIAVTAVRAMGGTGKTVLAQALCHHPAVQDAFPDGVLWAVIGQNPTDLHLITQMRELARSLGDDPARYDTLQGCGGRLRKTLQDKAALVVLDNVWDARKALPFITEALRSRVLITTRQQEVVKATAAQEFSLDVPERDQARALLAKWSGRAVEDLPPEAAEIIEECGRLPLAVAMAGAMARGSPDAWGRVLGRLREADLHPTLLSVIQASAEWLKPEHRLRYLDFAVFPADTPVPQSALQTLWNAHPDEVAEVVEAWVGASLANRDADGRITLHDSQMDYVRQQAANLPGLHRRLVEAYRSRSTQADDSYFLTWRAHHLWEAGERDELRRRLLDPDWMRSKLRKTDCTALLADYAFPLADPDVELVEETLRLSAHLLTRDPGLLTGQLAGRLMSVESPAIDELLESARRSEPGLWMEPLYQTLTPPGGPLLRTVEGHSRAVNAVAVTLDGRRAVSASNDRTVRLWVLERGELIRILRGHSDVVRAAAVTPDGKLAVSGSDDLTLRLWDLELGEEIGTVICHSGAVHVLAVTPDGRRAISCSRDRTLRLWDLERGEETRAFEGHSSRVTALAVMSDGKRAVSGSDDGILMLWDLERGEAIRTLRGHAIGICSVAVTPDGQCAVSSSYDGILMLWDLERGEAIRAWKGLTPALGVVALTPDGKRAVSGAYDRTLRLWNAEGGERIRALVGHSGGVGALAVAPDGQRVVSGSEDETLRLWDLERGEAIRTLEGHSDAVTAVAVTPNGKRAVSSSDDKTLMLWDLERGEAVRTLIGHSGSVTAVAVTPDGRRAISCSRDKTLMLWDLERGEALRTLEGHSDWVSSVAVAPNGQCAVSGSWDGTLKLWDLERGEAIRTLVGHAGPVLALALTPDGKHALSGSDDNTLKLWDLESGEAIRTLVGHSGAVNAVMVMPDGRRAVSGSSDSTLKLWELGSGKEIAAFGGDSAILSCAVAPDGRTFLAGDGWGCVHFVRLMGDQR
jgi:WD40 repeat protein